MARSLKEGGAGLLRRIPPAAIAALWGMDLFLLLTVIPIDGWRGAVGPVIFMWIVPTLPLLGLTGMWLWARARRASDPTGPGRAPPVPPPHGKGGPA